TTLTYNELDEIKTKVYSGESGMQTPAVTYTYDAFARLTKVDNGNLWEIVGFDPLDRPISSRQNSTYTAGYSYNLAGKRASMTLPSNRVINYSYDRAGR